MPDTLFISDLHLDPERPAVTELFLELLDSRAHTADAIYILGDLFEAWVGDDDTGPMNQAVCDGLKKCATSGTPVFIMHGNRDFLLGARFAAASGCTLLDDPALIDLYGTPALLMHGDLLCTDDKEYMAFRAMVRNTEWQRELLSRSLEERQLMAREMRDRSREQTGGKPEAIMDVNKEAVIKTMTGHKVQRLIHGHTHRPAIHDLVISGTPAQRIVLGDWYEQGSLLECTASGCRLEALEL
jgi:UDP-2,3-diacylglucosamine hydrolase